MPVLKIGQVEVFPGSGVWKAELKGDCATIEADYSMNLVGRMAVGGRRIDCRTFYRAREWLASQYRRHPELRKGILYGAELSRMVMSMKDAFVEVPTVGSVKTAPVDRCAGVSDPAAATIAVVSRAPIARVRASAAFVRVRIAFLLGSGVTERSVVTQVRRTRSGARFPKDRCRVPRVYSPRDRARWGASGALYPQSALAGLNPHPRPGWSEAAAGTRC